MRIRFVVGTVSVGVLVLSGVVAACGGDTEPADTGVMDAGNDVVAVDAAPVDAGADSGQVDAAPPCDTSGDFTNDIPDAALGGNSTVGLCTQCLRAECGSTIDACNADCNCRDFVGEVLSCYAAGGKTAEQCVFSSTVQPSAKTIQIAQGLPACLQQPCNDACAVDELTDAGPRDAGDGG